MRFRTREFRLHQSVGAGHEVGRQVLHLLLQQLQLASDFRDARVGCDGVFRLHLRWSRGWG